MSLSRCLWGSTIGTPQDASQIDRGAHGLHLPHRGKPIPQADFKPVSLTRIWSSTREKNRISNQDMQAMCCRCPDPRMHPKTPGEHAGSTPATARMGGFGVRPDVLGSRIKATVATPDRALQSLRRNTVTGFASNVSRPSICDAGQPQIR